MTLFKKVRYKSARESLEKAASRDIGRPLKAEKTVQVPLRLTENLRDKLEKDAKKQGLPLSTYIRTLIIKKREVEE